MITVRWWFQIQYFLFSPLPSCKLTWPWKIHHFDGIYQERWGFSWAMLVYQRVPGEMIQSDEHIFQMGWFNHQLDKLFCMTYSFAAKFPFNSKIALPKSSCLLLNIWPYPERTGSSTNHHI